MTEVNRHPLVADAQECESNSRARSAKLRIAKRNG
jgi:16S rRNA C1402 N4-methylase RsmH